MTEIEKFFEIKNKKERIELNQFRLSSHFITHIDEILKQREISLEEFAKMLGYSFSKVTRIWNFTKLITIKDIARIEEALQIKIKFRFS
jgi:transcriptional regulator with XRE-family HTH domain